MLNKTFEMYMTVVRHWHDGESLRSISNMMAISPGYVGNIVYNMRSKMGSKIVPYRYKVKSNVDNIVSLTSEIEKINQAVAALTEKLSDMRKAA